MSNISYWEFESYFKNIHDVVLGGGIVGLSTAYFLKKKNPKRRVIVIERDPLSAGASTKNAGFACYGSPSEILSDLEKMSRDEVAGLVRYRFEGLQSLRNLIGDNNIGYSPCGGLELFRSQDKEIFDKSVASIDMLNELLYNAIGLRPYSVRGSVAFEGADSFIGSVFNNGEGSIHTGAMMRSLKELCTRSGIEFFNGLIVQGVDREGSRPTILCNGFSFQPERLFVCINGFAKALLPELEVTAVRNQVLVTSVLKSSLPNCTYHVDEGFVYFRPIDGRILIGGFRNSDLENETTSDFGLTDKIQHQLESFITQYLTSEPLSIDYRWSGILGVGITKEPIVRRLTDHTYVGVRMGGMGIAIGNLIGKKLADLSN
ncbi:MAG: NAD(P)/FAD-dependent oxidoreductase [Flavobacteriales bacterium]|jgi:gamma-glutamylputrescine oxidase